MTKQKTRGLVTGSVTIGPAMWRKLQEVADALSPSLRVVKVEPTKGTRNRHSLTLWIEYGPVWGGWKCDVRRFINKALRAVETSARITDENLQRKIVP